MAYTIIRSNGAVLTTIPDGNINTTSTSLGLPGRNYPGYGQTLDTNFVRITENWANSSPPSNPLKGQLWYNTTLNTLNICPADGTSNASAWSVIATTSSGGSATLGNITVTGNISANNVAVSNDTTTNTITAVSGTFSSNIVVATANVTTANLATTRTAVITTGANTTAGTITGTWTANGGSSGNTFIVTNGNLVITGASTGKIGRAHV